MKLKAGVIGFWLASGCGVGLDFIVGTGAPTNGREVIFENLSFRNFKIPCVNVCMYVCSRILLQFLCMIEYRWLSLIR